MYIYWRTNRPNNEYYIKAKIPSTLYEYVTIHVNHVHTTFVPHMILNTVVD